MSKQDTPEKLYSLQEVAEILRVSERSVFRYIHGGKLRATKIGYWRISESDLKAFLIENENIRKEIDLVKEYVEVTKKGVVKKRKKK